MLRKAIAATVAALAVFAPAAAGGTPQIAVPPGSLSGTVPVTVDGANPNVSNIVLHVDGTPVAAGTSSPLTYPWNTTTVPDGTHTLSAVVAYKSGRTQSAERVVTVANSAPPPPPTSAPTVPTGLAATPGDGQVVLTWNANPTGENVDLYQVYVNDTERMILDVVGTTYTVTGLANGTQYSFRVSAHNSADYGPWTAPVYATPSGGAPPPVTPVSSPIGTHNANSPGYWPPRYEGYGYVSTEGPAPAGFTGLNLVYRSAITCSGYTNLSEATCVNNGWALRDAAGNIMRSQYGVLADPGNAGYQAAWAAASLQRITEQQEDGYWADDFTPSVQTLATCGCFPANRPSMDAYKAGLLSFARYMKTYFGMRGLTDSYNTGVALDNDGSLTAAWFAQLGPDVDYLTIEGWLTPNGFLRVSGPAWYQRWDEFRNFHRVAQQAGTGFLPMDYPAGPTSQAYVLGSFMLDWDGTAKDGFSVWNPGPVDAWIPFYDQALALGRPVAAPVSSGNVHTRQFEGGTLRVDSGAATASITLS